MENNISNIQPQGSEGKKSKKWLIGLVLVFFVIIIILARNNNSSNNNEYSSLDDNGNVFNKSKFPATSDIEIADLKSKVNKDLSYDLVNTDTDKYKGEIIQWGAKVFTEPERDEEGVYFQAYAGGDNKNFAVLYRKPDFEIKEGDYIIIIGAVKGKFEGENAFGAKLSIPTIEAGYIEAGTRNEVVAPASEIIPINNSVTQNQFTVTLERIELAENETRFFIKLKNDSEDEISFYTYDSKLAQGSKQYEAESIYDSEMELPSSVLPGIESEGVVVFSTIDRNEKELKLFFDEPYASENYDLDWNKIVFNVTLP